MNPSAQRFAVRWSRLTWVVTLTVSIIVALIPVLILRAARDAGPPGSALPVLLTVLAFAPLIIFGILAFFAPLAFEVNSDAVAVKRLCKNVVVPLENIREIRRVQPGEARFTWRLCGCGGFLGWFGLFYRRPLGEFWAYAGNQEDLLLLTQTNGTKIMISPYPPDAFLEAVWETEAGRRLR